MSPRAKRHPEGAEAVKDTNIRLVAHQEIDPEALEEFKELICAYSADTEAEDAGVLEYEFFINAEGTEATVNELYADSQGFLDHFERMGPHLQRFNEISRIVDSVVLGDPEPRARELLATALNATFYSRAAGFCR
jgi:hypothetical protein